MIGVCGDPVHAENHADMLQSSIGIQQLRADGTDCRVLRYSSIAVNQSPSTTSRSSLNRTTCSPADSGHAFVDLLARN